MARKRLQDLAAMSLFTHVQAQEEMSEYLADAISHVDVDAGVLTLRREHQQCSLPLQLLGVIDQAAGTWTWGWDERASTRVPEPSRLIAERVLASGRAIELPQLTTPVITLAETPSLLLRLAAETIGGVNHTLVVNAEPGEQVVFAVEAGPLKLPDGQSLLSTAMRGADLGVTDNHREAFECYARRVGLEITRIPHAPSWTRVRGPEGGIEFETDETGRLTSLQALSDAGKAVAAAGYAAAN